MGRLEQKKIDRALQELPGWSFGDNSLVKECTFEAYMDGITFVNRLAEKAEEHDHHPDLEIGWCRVEITFTSHDSGGVTERDVKMAKVVESLL
ncbi:MAG: 4a-hydroxytetrahydrobiopterin dehydratase [Candidatus Marinimicrobia bacterium]|jgi:4a-hydroxytetrahydrobiopterin dehydratase|uniref:4a-hydroxytetrahydrobiopterin dehydratase n=1 Tax=marine metagenome TaxID=408172 RepID=A0A381WFX8_9ZZZZ|nr:4a-hydroxytetrahydrobiopterin dehydratase [Candidatus Neomarinimicrobiota bacterium]|tara:strand:+ start:1523 stop:1801 length:279 start_codon:yes stop_codon:yes gene_type:complete